MNSSILIWIVLVAFLSFYLAGCIQTSNEVDLLAYFSDASDYCEHQDPGRDYCVYRAALWQHSSAICEKAGKLADDCKFDLALESKDISMCTPIPDTSYQKGDCVAILSKNPSGCATFECQYKANFAAGNDAYCDTLSNVDDQKAECLFNLALERKDISICGKIERKYALYPELKDRTIFYDASQNACYLYMAAKLKDPNKCELVDIKDANGSIRESEVFVKDDCYEEVALELMDSSLCKNLVKDYEYFLKPTKPSLFGDVHTYHCPFSVAEKKLLLTYK